MLKANLTDDTKPFVETIVEAFANDQIDMGYAAVYPASNEDIPVTCTQVLEKENFTFVEFTYDEDVNSVVNFIFMDGNLRTVTVKEHTINGLRTKTLINNGVPDSRQKARNLKF